MPTVVRRVCVALALLVGIGSVSALEPATWQIIATGIASYMQSQEGQCQVHACNCDKCNQGAKNRCHEIVRRLHKFTEDPNDFTAKQVYDITGSARTQCMAKAIASDNQWERFMAHRGQ